MTTILNRQSTLIEATRFPLIVMVVITHSAITFPTSTIEWSFSGQNVYHFMVELISGHLCTIATRCFFLFSGFLLFRFLKEEDFSFSWILSKWKKRFWSLLIPYLLWNLLMVAALLIKNSVFQSLSFYASPEELSILDKGPVYWFFTGPADFPLWYIRDLIIMTFVAPLLYPVIKRFRWGFLTLMAILYFAPINLPFHRIGAVFFYSVGAWLAIQKIDFLPLCQKLNTPAFIATGIILPITTLMVGRPAHSILFKCFVPVGVISFINLSNLLINNMKITKYLCAKAGSSFFIYAAHEIYIIWWTKGLCLRLFGDSLGALWLRYLFVPIISVGICEALFYLLGKVIPRTLSFICGGRVSSVPR